MAGRENLGGPLKSRQTGIIDHLSMRKWKSVSHFGKQAWLSALLICSFDLRLFPFFVPIFDLF